MKCFSIKLIAFKDLLTIVMTFDTWFDNWSIKLNTTPSTFISLFDNTLILPILILIGAYSCLWNKHRSVLLLFTFRPAFCNQFVLILAIFPYLCPGDFYPCLIKSRNCNPQMVKLMLCQKVVRQRWHTILDQELNPALFQAFKLNM